MEYIKFQEEIERYESLISTHTKVLDASTEDVTKELFRFLVSDDANKLKHITYGTLLQVLYISSDDVVEYTKLVKAVDLLSSNKVPMLEMRFQFIENDHADAHKVSPEELHLALKSGRYYHPESGEVVEAFEEKIYPYFERSNELKKIQELDKK